MGVIVAVPVVVGMRLVGRADDDDAPARADHVDRRVVELAQHIGAQHLRRGADAEPAAGEVEDAVDVLEHRVHVVRYEEHAESHPTTVAVDEVAHHALRAEIERAQRLVAEQESRVARERWPQLSAGVLIVFVCFPAMMVFDFVLEGLVAIPSGLYVYPGSHFALFPDAYNKYPLYLVGPWNLAQRFLMHGFFTEHLHARLEQLRRGGA